MTNYQEIWPSGLVPIGPWSKVKVNKPTMNGRRSTSTIMMQSLTLIPLYPQIWKLIIIPPINSLPLRPPLITAYTHILLCQLQVQKYLNKRYSIQPLVSHPLGLLVPRCRTHGSHQQELHSPLSRCCRWALSTRVRAGVELSERQSDW